MLFPGPRRGEAAGLSWPDLDFESVVIQIRGEGTSSRRHRPVRSSPIPFSDVERARSCPGAVSESVEEGETGNSGEHAVGRHERNGNVNGARSNPQVVGVIVGRILDHENVSRLEYGSPHQLVLGQIARQQRAAVGHITLICGGVALTSMVRANPDVSVEVGVE